MLIRNILENDNWSLRDRCIHTLGKVLHPAPRVALNLLFLGRPPGYPPSKPSEAVPKRPQEMSRQ